MFKIILIHEDLRTGPNIPPWSSIATALSPAQAWTAADANFKSDIWLQTYSRERQGIKFLNNASQI